MMIEPVWWEYAIFDENGFLCGLDSNAPNEMKEAYKTFLKEEKERKEKGIKI
jgi:hypothetical protein